MCPISFSVILIGRVACSPSVIDPHSLPNHFENLPRRNTGTLHLDTKRSPETLVLTYDPMQCCYPETHRHIMITVLRFTFLKCGLCTGFRYVVICPVLVLPPLFLSLSLSLSLSHTHTPTNTWNINPRSGFLLRKVINFPPFVESDGSLHSLPQPAPCPSPKPHESSLSFPTLIPTSNISIYTLVFRQVSSPKSYTLFSSPLYVPHSPPSSSSFLRSSK